MNTPWGVNRYESLKPYADPFVKSRKKARTLSLSGSADGFLRPHGAGFRFIHKSGRGVSDVADLTDGRFRIQSKNSVEFRHNSVFS